MYQLLDGKKLAAPIIEHVAQTILSEGIEPQLAVVLVGSDPASHLYVRLKKRACKEVGIGFSKYLINESEPEEKIIETIRFLNANTDIDAVLIQMPLPGKFNQDRVLEALDYRKDVDGFHRTNIQRYLAGKPQKILPGLALAIWNLIAGSGEEHYAGKNAVIVAKSESFTKATAKLLSDRGLRVTIARPDDTALAEKTRDAAVLITAIGKPLSITEDMVKKDAVIIDVGISATEKGTTGDVDFVQVAPKASFITPVPGGVGPMTIAMLLANTLSLAQMRKTK